MESSNPDYQAYNQNNQISYQNNQGNNNGGFNGFDTEKIFLLLSIGSWLLLLICGWLCFAVPDIDLSVGKILITWNYIIAKKNALDLPVGIHYVPFYMILIATLLFLTAGFVVYIYSIFMKKDANVMNGMLGNMSRFHFIPLVCISSLFIIGETINEDFDIKGAHFFFNIFFTVIALSSLIYIYIQTKIESPLYALWTIKRGTYGCFIPLLIHNIFYGISFYGFYLIAKKDKDPTKWIKGCNIAFSIIIGLANMITSLVLKEIVIAVINLLMYIGMTIFFFKIGKKNYKKLYTVAPGVIDIFMIFFSLIFLTFLFLKEKNINFINVNH